MAQAKETKQPSAVKQAASGAVKSTIAAGASKAVSAAVTAVVETSNAIAPVVGHFLAMAAGWLTNTILRPVLDWIDKHKEYLLVPGVIGAGIAFGFPALAITGVIMGILFWVVGFWSLVTAFLSAIAIAFATLILGVTIILFIINSGAYIVPGVSLENSPYVGGTVTCVQTKGPMTLIPTNNTSTPIAFRAWQIVADLYQGFWCFWNRPPLNPPGNSNFPNDVTLYPPNYPNLFDVATFLTDPNIDPAVASQRWDILFWCTSLVWKSYSETVGWWPQSLSASGQENYFIAHHQYVTAAQARPSNVPVGSAIFFRVGTESTTGHVGVVYSLNSDALLYVQSNAGDKEGSITFSASGVGVISLPGLTVTGFGTP